MDTKDATTPAILINAIQHALRPSVHGYHCMEELARRIDKPKVVPPSGIEPEPQSGSNFKSDVSTNSTKGAYRYLKFTGRDPFPQVMADVLGEIKMPFGWGLEARTFLGEDRKKDWMELQVRIICGPTVGNMTGEALEGWNGRWWRLSQHMTPGEIVQTVFKATMTALEHEAREMFLYKGVSVLDPHYDIDKMAEFRKQKDSLRGREEVKASAGSTDSPARYAV